MLTFKEHTTMKNILKAFFLLTITTVMAGCGSKFLDTKYYAGIDAETGLSSVDNIGTALSGTYNRLFRYQFAGDYSINVGDLPTDITYWNGQNGHFNNVYQFTYTDTESYLESIWQYGYKVIDNAARVIKGAAELYDDATPSEQQELDTYVAEAYALKGYAELTVVNVFAHQVKVAGQDFSSKPGIVLVDEPVEAYAQVSRSTVGETYDAILADFESALSYFDAAGGDRGSLVYFGVAAVYGLLARTHLYLEDWSEAASYAQKALDEAGITTLTYGDDAYKALYNNGTSNTESMFALAISSIDNWSANSSGTLWSTYCYSPSPKLQSLYGENDCRLAVWDWDAKSTPQIPMFGSGKFSHFESGNPAYGTSYIVNASEMFLILAECYAQTGSISDAQDALLTVAKRDADITSTSDLPSSASEILEFLQDERARELFQEGHRLWDLRRWGVKTDVYAYNAPDIAFTYTDYQISDLVFPIPSDEITSGFGVEQNEDWASTRPR